MEREAKEKEWAAQEAERSGEWYYKEVRPSSHAALILACCPHCPGQPGLQPPYCLVYETVTESAGTCTGGCHLGVWLAVKGWAGS